jgi:hypothetical protein
VYVCVCVCVCVCVNKPQNIPQKDCLFRADGVRDLKLQWSEWQLAENVTHIVIWPLTKKNLPATSVCFIFIINSSPHMYRCDIFMIYVCMVLVTLATMKTSKHARGWTQIWFTNKLTVPRSVCMLSEWNVEKGNSTDTISMLRAIHIST